ncbi:hypothetical protein BDF22DRAFT_401799 [Syncephalis plumigaleata]|nr:hypothetical protein BDF22DRAFT_401799 [Syncephalis plumigaleata]
MVDSMIVNFIYITLSLLYLQVPAFARVSLNVGHDRHLYTTQDVFSTEPDKYAIKGVLVMLGFDATTRCNGYENAHSVVPAVTAASARQAGCRTITDVGVAVDMLSRSLKTADGPKFNVLLYLLDPSYGPAAGSPYTSYYIDNETVIPDGYPPFTLALLAYGNILDDQQQPRTYTTPIMVELEEEAGIWNDMNFSMTNSVFRILMLVIMVYFVVRSTIVLFKIRGCIKTIPGKRLAAFLLSFLGLICLLVKHFHGHFSVYDYYLGVVSQVSIV